MDKHRWKHWFGVGSAILGFVVLFLGWLHFRHYDVKFNLARDMRGMTPNEWGDWIGGVMGFYASIATTLLFLAALLFQSHEISLQVQEMKETREELGKQTEQLTQQTRVTRNQSLISQITEIASQKNAAIDELLRIQDIDGYTETTPIGAYKARIRNAKDYNRTTPKNWVKNSRIDLQEAIERVSYPLALHEIQCTLMLNAEFSDVLNASIWAVIVQREETLRRLTDLQAELSKTIEELPH